MASDGVARPATNDDRELVEAINAETGDRLVLTGRATDGTSGGAVFVDLGDGLPGVVTHFLGSLSHARLTSEVLRDARRRGVPVPQHHRVIRLGSDVFVVQERLPGASPTKITAQVMDAVVEVNDRFAHLLADRPDVPTMPLCLERSGEPHPRHEILANHSDRSRRVLAAIRDIGQRHRGELSGDDLLHVDLDLSNILLDADGVVTGVVDWNLGVYRGDRNLALVKTRFEQEWALRSPHPAPDLVAAADHLDTILVARISPADLQRYWAHRMLSQLHWILQKGPPDVIDWHLSLAEDRLI